MSAYSDRRAEKKEKNAAFADTPEGKKAAEVKANNLNNGMNLAGAAIDILPGMLGGTKADIGNPVLDTTLTAIEDVVGNLGP